MKRSANWSLPKLKAYYRSWVESKESQKFARDDARKQVSELLTQPDAPAALVLIAAYLNKIVQWESSFGAHTVLAGEPSGWHHLFAAADFQSLELRIKRHTHASVTASGRAYPVPLIHRAISRCSVHATAVRNDRAADWCGGVVLAELGAPTGFLKGWDETPFHRLVAWLYAIWRKHPFPPAGARLRDLGVYQSVADGWGSDAAFRKAILQACDYHCTRYDPDVDDNGEFWPSPLDVFPAEILALCRVRREVLGADVLVSHPLLDSPLGIVPEIIPYSVEPLLRQIEDHVAQVEKSSPGVGPTN